MPTQKFRMSEVDHQSERGIEERLRAIDGVLFASVNHEDACVEVEYEDDAVSALEILAALREMGYDAQAAS